MPPDLSPIAQAFWRRLIEAARYLRILSFVDGVALQLAAESWEVYVDAHDEVRRHGITLETTRGRMTNPSVRVRDKSFDQLNTILKQFGMNPLARTGLKSFQGFSNDEAEERRVDAILNMCDDSVA